MKIIQHQFVIVILSILLLSGCSTQNNLTQSNDNMKNKEAVLAFYEKALTVNKDTRPTKILTPLFTEGYQSYSSVDSKGADQLMGQLEFFWQLIPDLNWTPQQIVNEGNVYVVRSLASGTPDGDFMGTITDGIKPFEIMTIDIHTMKDGKFVSTYHVEDWMTAIKQLTPALNTNDKNADAMSIANAFMESMGKGDMETMVSLMHEDMVWQNEGDKSMPWIGPWNGKTAILEEFMPLFMKHFKTIKWEPDDALSSGDTAAFFGRMIGQLTQSNVKTKEFTYALRVKVKDGKVILWNWFEDSYEVSRAFHGQ